MRPKTNVPIMGERCLPLLRSLWSKRLAPRYEYILGKVGQKLAFRAGFVLQFCLLICRYQEFEDGYHDCARFCAYQRIDQ